MDKEAQEKIKDIIKERSHLMITASHYNQLDDATYDSHANNMAGAILAQTEELGYRKLPKDKPPLLKYQTNHKIIAGSKEWHNIEGYNLGAQTQRKADTKHYEGVKDGNGFSK